MRNKDVIMGWYKKLRDIYGAPQGQWQLWCRRPKTTREREQVIMEAILTQRTNWRNVERTVAALGKRHLLSLGAFLNAYRKNHARTALLIKSSGFYQQKAERLAGLAAFIKKRYGTIATMKKVPLMRLRTDLLSLNGIGPETADSILLYALDKPIFVIDEYTRCFLDAKFLNVRNAEEDHFYNRPALPVSPPAPTRLSDRGEPKSGRSAIKVTYEELQNYFQKNLKKDYRLYQDFHALVVIDAKNKI